MEKFPDLHNVSIPTICRGLHHDCQLSRKKLEKRAKRAIPQEMIDYEYRLGPFYQFKHQLVFIDETAKDGRSAIRQYAWSKIGTPAVVTLPSDRGPRVSTLAAFNHDGFFAWKHTRGTFSRRAFHDAFIEKILPHLNPWPMPNSILILDNARIHMYQKLETVVHSRGALMFYLPPYSPQCNPIEYGFSSVKKNIQKKGNLAFHHNPERVLDVALGTCVRRGKLTLDTMEHCGYKDDRELKMKK